MSDPDSFDWHVVADPVRAAATALQEHVAGLPDISLNHGEEYIAAAIMRWKQTYTEVDAGISGAARAEVDDGIFYTWSEGWGT